MYVYIMVYIHNLAVESLSVHTCHMIELVIHITVMTKHTA